MITTKQHRFEIIFYSALFGVVGFATGYFIAAAYAAYRVHEALK